MRWHEEDGWGVLASPEVDGEVFAHYSMIRDQAPWRGVHDGQPVWFSWEPHGQDGCPNRAVDVYTTPELRAVPWPSDGQDGGGEAFQSWLVIEFDDLR